MDDTVKLIVEISKENLKRISDGEWIGTHAYDNMILNGTPLDDVKAEIRGMEYHMIDCDVLVSQEEVLEILDNIGSEVKPNDK